MEVDIDLSQNGRKRYLSKVGVSFASSLIFWELSTITVLSGTGQWVYLFYYFIENYINKNSIGGDTAISSLPIARKSISEMDLLAHRLFRLSCKLVSLKLGLKDRHRPLLAFSSIAICYPTLVIVMIITSSRVSSLITCLQSVLSCEIHTSS